MIIVFYIYGMLLIDTKFCPSSIIHNRYESCSFVGINNKFVAIELVNVTIFQMSGVDILFMVVASGDVYRLLYDKFAAYKKYGLDGEWISTKYTLTPNLKVVYTKHGVNIVERYGYTFGITNIGALINNTLIDIGYIFDIPYRFAIYPSYRAERCHLNIDSMFI